MCPFQIKISLHIIKIHRIEKHELEIGLLYEKFLPLEVRDKIFLQTEQNIMTVQGNVFCKVFQCTYNIH